MSEDLDNDAARAEYEKVRPLYKQLACEVLDILSNKFAKTDFRPASIICRPKTLDSFVDKITRKNYSEPLLEMTDLAGVRVTYAYEAELAVVEQIIEESFDVRERIDKARELGVDRMGYNGKAFVVTLGSGYTGGRYENITDLKCEIQARTILQDAWATINHQLVYKSEASTPEPLRRDLNNVASLLEIAQGIFDSVKDKRAEYIREIGRMEVGSSAFLAQPLNFDTVIAYTRWKFPDREPSDSLTQRLLRDIDLKDYPTLQILDALVERTRAAVKAYQKENPDWFTTGTDFITKSLGFADHKFRAKHGFASRTRDAFDRLQNLVAE